MTHIFVPHQFRAGRGEFYRLANDLATDEEQAAAVLNGFIRNLKISFIEDARREGKNLEQIKGKITEAEKRRRVEIIAMWFRRLRGDYGFSAIRSVELSGKALRAELDGETFTPPVERKLWAPH